jgi:hypothetical protein
LDSCYLGGNDTHGCDCRNEKEVGCSAKECEFETRSSFPYYRLDPPSWKGEQGYRCNQDHYDYLHSLGQFPVIFTEFGPSARELNFLSGPPFARWRLAGFVNHDFFLFQLRVIHVSHLA